MSTTSDTAIAASIDCAKLGQTAGFDREAPDFAEAIFSATRAVEVPGARVVEFRREHDIFAAG